MTGCLVPVLPLLLCEVGVGVGGEDLVVVVYVAGVVDGIVVEVVGVGVQV